MSWVAAESVGAQCGFGLVEREERGDRQRGGRTVQVRPRAVLDRGLPLAQPPGLAGGERTWKQVQHTDSGLFVQAQSEVDPATPFDRERPQQRSGVT